MVGFTLSGSKADDKTTKTAAKSKLAPDSVPGYRRMVIEGFTLLVSDDVLKHNDDKFDKKPLEVLELELKTLVRVLHVRALNVIRNVLIWVEWNEAQDLTNGREGSAVAVYYGGHQLSMLKQGKHPLKANAVSILSMKKLTDEHQPKTDSGRCVILHEIAHAVHHQLVNFENPYVKTAFKQAMERKLYDTAVYAATNEKEYFAEISCAYLDKLHYFPHTRADLKKHDPAGHSLMERIWGKTKDDATKKAASARPASEFDLEITLEGAELGKRVFGPAWDGQLKGKVTLLVCWDLSDDTSLASLQKLGQWQRELEDFGLVIVANHSNEAPIGDIKKKVQERDLICRVVTGANVVAKKTGGSYPLPHAFLFDHSGTCIYRAAPLALEAILRDAVGQALVDSFAQEEFTKPVMPLVESLQKGQAPLGVLTKLAALQTSPMAETAEEAKVLVAKLIAPAQERLAQAEALMKDDPLQAFLQIEKLSAAYKVAPLSTRANDLLTRLRKEKPVVVELKARPVLDKIKKLDTFLSGRPGAFDPTKNEFKAANAAALRQMTDTLLQMRKSFPDTQATRDAGRIALRYGIAP